MQDIVGSVVIVEYKDTGVECWDYTLGKAEDDTVYIRREEIGIAEVEHNGWRYVDVSDRKTSRDWSGHIVTGKQIGRAHV